MARRPKYRSPFQGRHFVAKSARATFWAPTRKMIALGFKSVPLGPDGKDAWERSEQWEARWQAVRKGKTPSPAVILAGNLSPEKSEELTIYPIRSLGEAFRKLRGMNEWERKAPKTREDW